MFSQIDWILGGAANAVTGGGIQSSQAGSASKSGARAGRVVRLVRMVRLVRLVKLFKYASIATASSHQDKNEMLKGVSTADSLTEKLGELPKESHVGAAMSEITNRRCTFISIFLLTNINITNNL
jgi:hypothetical protein